AVLLGMRLPMVNVAINEFQREFTREFKQSFNREFDRAFNEARGNNSARYGSELEQNSPDFNPINRHSQLSPDPSTAMRDQIQSRRLSPNSTYTIGEQLDWNFRDHTWRSGLLPSGQSVVRFEGTLSPDGAYELRSSLMSHLDTSRLRNSRQLVEDAIHEIHPGSIIQLDFAIKPDGRHAEIEWLGTENTTLSNSDLPLKAWVDALVQ
ncbi:MAG: hypothetical protein AB7E55_18240, partial [Pigmentiphaga sp.]